MSTLNAAMEASASALSAERLRIEVAVSNLANAESTRSENGQPYRRRDVVLSTESVNSFDSALGRASATGVEVVDVLEDQSPSAVVPSESTEPKALTSSFGELLASVEQSAGAANDAVRQMLDGTGDVHDAMIALQRADMTLQLTVQVRNKLVQAYQEIMRMPV
jgi:flagellar hook-basal body complex protein FliE